MSRPRRRIPNWFRCGMAAWIMQFLLTMSPPTLRGPVSVARWSAEWLELVRSGTISSTATLRDGREVRYGLRIAGSEGENEIAEFCEDLRTGTSLQLQTRVGRRGQYLVVLRANRALRPPAAPKLGWLPPHDEATCSFCSGPLRLELRPMVAQALLPETGRCWDVHFNISPMEPNGHYLLVPETALHANRRQQLLTRDDCIDLVLIGRACAGELCVNFNAPRAGASQNHLHAHAWAIPEAYPIATAPVLSRVVLPGGVEACVLLMAVDGRLPSVVG